MSLRCVFSWRSVAAVTAVLLTAACSSEPELTAEEQARANLQLRGDRFPGLKYEDMTPAQQAITDRALKGRGAIGSFNIMLRAPELSETIRSASGFRGQTELPARLSELGIIVNARYYTTQFEWLVHRNAAHQAGISEEITEAIRTGRRPEFTQSDEAAVYDYLRELLTTKQVSDATLARVRQEIGDKSLVDLIGIVGSYQFTSLLMNTDRYPMATADQIPELELLENPLPLE